MWQGRNFQETYLGSQKLTGDRNPRGEILYAQYNAKNASVCRRQPSLCNAQIDGVQSSKVPNALFPPIGQGPLLTFDFSFAHISILLCS